MNETKSRLDTEHARGAAPQAVRKLLLDRRADFARDAEIERERDSMPPEPSTELVDALFPWRKKS